jgi:multisubunit Na+/H+ antiporter MnhF subunit
MAKKNPLDVIIHLSLFIVLEATMLYLLIISPDFKDRVISVSFLFFFGIWGVIQYFTIPDKK